jgi:hypothetical protein
MRYIGQILASAGGVFVTSASNVYIGQNNISHSSRWGIAVRSNLGASSGNIAVEGNRISDTGLLTADFGAISFIDHTDTHNVTGNRVVGNCVQRTRGMRDATFQNKPGELMFPFWGRGLYLDDRSSNVEVSRNVFKDSSHAAVFVHGGCRNLITNNVFYHQGGVEFLIKLNKGWHIEGNAFERNVVYSATATTAVEREEALLGGLGDLSKWTSALVSVDDNLYWRKEANLRNPTYVRRALIGEGGGGGRTGGRDTEREQRERVRESESQRVRESESQRELVEEDDITTND